MIFTLDIDPKIVNEIKIYLKKFDTVEEGGLLLGNKIITNSDMRIKVTEFCPIKSTFKKYDFDAGYQAAQILPGEEVGYYPDPEEYMNVLKRTKSFIDTDLLNVGFVHNHFKWEANPSSYDLKHVMKTIGYVMAIYTNLHDHIKFWYVTQQMQKEKWTKSQKSSSSAAVELAAIL